VLDVLDYSNGETLFSSFVKRFFIDDQFRFKDDFDHVLRLAHIFIKQKVAPPGPNTALQESRPALLTELLGIMFKYFTL